MKYLCLSIRESRSTSRPRRPTDLRRLRRVTGTPAQRPLSRLAIASCRLQTATTVRVRRASVDDRRTLRRDQGAVGGYYIIEATRPERGDPVAARMPGAAVGCIEVRPIRPIRETVAGVDALQHASAEGR